MKVTAAHQALYARPPDASSELKLSDASWDLLDRGCLQSEASLFESQEGQTYSIFDIQTDTYISKSLDFTGSKKACLDSFQTLNLFIKLVKV